MGVAFWIRASNGVGVHRAPGNLVLLCLLPIYQHLKRQIQQDSQVAVAPFGPNSLEMGPHLAVLRSDWYVLVLGGINETQCSGPMGRHGGVQAQCQDTPNPYPDTWPGLVVDPDAF